MHICFQISKMCTLSCTFGGGLTPPPRRPPPPLISTTGNRPSLPIYLELGGAGDTCRHVNCKAQGRSQVLEFFLGGGGGLSKPPKLPLAHALSDIKGWGGGCPQHAPRGFCVILSSLIFLGFARPGSIKLG